MPRDVRGGRGKISFSSLCQSDEISHIDTVIFHIDIVIFQINTVIFWSSSISILSSSISILSSFGHLPYRYCHLRVIFRMDTVILSSCEQDDQIISCHSGGAAGDDFISSECSDPRRAGLQQVAHTSGHAACVRVTLRILFVTVSVEEGVCTSAPHRTALSHTTPEPPQSAVRAGRVWG